MRKLVGFTFIILLVVGSLSIYKIIECNSYNNLGKDNTKINKISGEIDSLDKEIKDNEDKLEKIKNDNKEKVDLVNLWQEEIKKIKAY